MKAIRGCFTAMTVATVLATTLTPTNAAELYNVEPAHTAVIFSISHFGYSFTYGRFNKTSGRFALDRENPANSEFEFIVDVASIDTNDAKRDEHLRAPDFFDVTSFPTIVFRSTAVTKTEKRDETGVVIGNGYDVMGNLTLHGITKQITLPVVVMGEGPGPDGKYRAGMNFQLQIKRSDFDMKTMVGPIGDNVAITASFEGIRDEQ